MPDMMLTCQDCDEEFEFSEGEQQFFETKGFTPPKRCKPCREKRKQSQGGDGGKRERR